MAATFSVAQPTTPIEQQHASYLITPPTSGAGTPANLSPISPRAPWHIPRHFQQPSRQLRPPKQPMYVPAVLRPTEKPIRQSPPKDNTQQGTAYGSPDSLSNFSAHMPQSPDMVRGPLSRIVTEEWNEGGMGPVTGAPSRNHWKPDTASVACDSPVCDKMFSFFERRHHCRRCGNIFCYEHSISVAPLDQHARFHPEGVKNRACDACFSDYRTWAAARASRANSIATPDSGSETIKAPTAGMPIGRETNEESQPKGLVSTLAQSIPRDWNWSTF